MSFFDPETPTETVHINESLISEWKMVEKYINGTHQLCSGEYKDFVWFIMCNGNQYLFDPEQNKDAYRLFNEYLS